MNKVFLIGRLTKDIELRYTENNTAVGNLTLAVNRSYKNEKGEYDADFINCICWEKTAEVISKYSKKGDQLAISGRIQTRNYEDKEGKKHYITEIVIEKVEFVGNKREETKTEKNEYENMSIKTESRVELDSDVKLPWEE